MQEFSKKENVTKANSEPITENAYTITDVTNGTHTYKVGAVYEGSEFTSYELSATTKTADQYFPSVSTISGTIERLVGSIAWTTPQLRKNDELTWSSKVYGNAIGGTASSNTKVWIKNEFAPADLIALEGYQITGINTSFKEKEITGITLFVIKNGKIDYSEEIGRAHV